MHPILICMALGTLFGAGLAVATEQVPVQPSSSPVAKYRDQLRAADQNGDGMLSRVEAQRARLHHIAESFDRLDADRDGLLTAAEIRQMIKTRISS
ncbi:hypothetical protein [Noviherbaspirillum aridicola]|uniref:EF-hand domain-containing protein n=1 Tax=Noviherbaspirillum aridicola TaxID=2849687 RepID=A0ABQ4Q195_9BURK|nr:hypothetical protein [Noviherbaspirillum aridicola]GIZ50811.1 hypothetical protein NCCP691_08250 [Noviherbaspirillum aridicola]